ncbi:MAG: hypothetical protein A2381_15785 [Bdellovibrionales bacterium RIFOXYB1_FULL_37_110]|nr:MAG: hypothetical protein A2417_07635 [Bdellovibrionales bacterium RIFOXYC1_FULL_37_79]OFZ57076.1 MAG: hypothetical protein A2381_15785 [Bdellovibrionales bacterium RIFOXYB1_FULL_37_110]OFZ62073.1 MAG: hypothetical protein A2577_08445 [Bdellovibrionales bacterium RIFOXYD1_FULL_36_51]
MQKKFIEHSLNKYKKLSKFSRALAMEKNHQRLLELILKAIKDITNSDGGTIYIKTEHETLAYAVILNTSLNIKMGGTYSSKMDFKELSLYESNNRPNEKNISCFSAINKEVIIVDDVYADDRFNFTGTKTFDLQYGYKTRSILTIPLLDLENEVIGVVQLINARDENNQTCEYDRQDVELAGVLASHAAITLSNHNLQQKLENLFVQFAESLAIAIDSKSQYTETHCTLVSDLALMITKAVSDSNLPTFANFRLTPPVEKEMRLATLLHDCGKVCTPTHIMDKATKLETIHDRINLIKAKFEILMKDLKIELLQSKIEKKETDSSVVENEINKKIKSLTDDMQFLEKANIGKEFMSDLDQQRIRNISKLKVVKENGQEETLLSDNEVENLMIKKGTLLDSERNKINEHAEMTLRILKSLDFPKHLKNIPEIAGGHHEKLNGKGYPRGLKGEEILLQARILGIADIFEALTARDRPYKKGKTLSESLKIVGMMVEDGELDEDIFRLFVDSGVYLTYANKYLTRNQIDTVDLNTLPGYAKKKVPRKKAA